MSYKNLILETDTWNMIYVTQRISTLDAEIAFRSQEKYLKNVQIARIGSSQMEKSTWIINIWNKCFTSFSTVRNIGIKIIRKWRFFTYILPIIYFFTSVHCWGCDGMETLIPSRREGTLGQLSFGISLVWYVTGFPGILFDLLILGIQIK